MKTRLIRFNLLVVLTALCILVSQSWAETWKVSFNGYPGTMEMSGSQNNYTGRFNLHGTWEQMLDLRVYRNAIFFRRASADQKYLGIIEDGRMHGIFSQGGAGSYPWTAERVNSQDADPFADGAGYQPPPVQQGEVRNLAIKRAARQSSMDYGGAAERAVDGNRDGNYWANSVTHTGNARNEWWEVDLGGQKQIRQIKIWNRTDCCSERLSNFYVMVSPHPFPGGDLQTALNTGTIWSYQHAAAAGRETTLPVTATGRYVRIQLAGQNWLSLAEVEVSGYDNAAPIVTPSAGQDGGGVPVTIYWHMADDADVYLNGRPLRQYSPSFKTRPDEAPRPAFSARARLKDGDVFTVGGRRGGSYGLMLIAVDDNGRIVFKTDRNAWAVYEPGERSDWYDPSVAAVSSRRPVTVQPDPWYPQKELNARYHNSALSIWSEPSNQFAYLLGMVRISGHAGQASRFNPSGTWRHHPNATWVITQNQDGSYHAQEYGLGNASGPGHFTDSGSFRIDYVTRDGAVSGYYEVTFSPDGRSATGQVRELTGPKRSGNTSWTRQ